MKKQLFLLAAAVGIAAFSQAQIAQPAAFKTSMQTETTFTGSTILPKVAKKFYAAYPNATDAAWVKLKAGYLVRFTAKEIDYTLFLDNRGNNEGEIKNYSEKDLNSEVRKLVKSIYFDYSIKSVKEINVNHATGYLITIEDATSWKIIHVVDNEMEVSEEYLKG